MPYVVEVVYVKNGRSISSVGQFRFPQEDGGAAAQRFANVFNDAYYVKPDPAAEKALAAGSPVSSGSISAAVDDPFEYYRKILAKTDKVKKSDPIANECYMARPHAEGSSRW